MSAVLARTATYQRERIADLWPELTPLLERHWREIATFKDIPLDVDVERYNASEKLGLFRMYTARVEGDLVGYAVFLVSGGLHYKSSKLAIEDVLYVAHEHRRGRIGIMLIAFSEAQLRSDGVQAVYHHQKLAHPALGKILERRGYQHVENIWVKRLDGGE